MGAWWDENIVEPGKLPLLLCLLAFVVTFLVTRTVTRLIRAGVGPFRNNVSASGVHIHHAVPGIVLLIIGALMAVRGNDSPWSEIAGILVGIGMSLVLDEFALILHLSDVYWAREGRISVELIGLTTACLGLVMIGASPLGVEDLTIGDVQLRLTFVTAVIVHFVLVLVCVLKGKYRVGLIALFVPIVAWVAPFRLARPTSWWARRFYRHPKKIARARARSERIDARWDPRWAWLGDFIAGSPSDSLGGASPPSAAMVPPAGTTTPVSSPGSGPTDR